MKLDAIDLAYLKHETPTVRIWGVLRDADRFHLLRTAFFNALPGKVFYLPSGAGVEFIGPDRPSPFELARWADDGGPV